MARLGPEWKRLTATAGGNKIPAQQALMALVTDNYGVGISTDGEPYVFDRTVPGVAIPLEGAVSLKDRLHSDLYMLTSITASPEALGSVLGMIRGMAVQAEPVRPRLRTARLPDGRIAIDLGRRDGSAVLCGPHGWEICTRGLALFRRTDFTLPLPVPLHGGDARPALGLVNLRDWNAKAVYSACRIMACIPGVTLPAEILTGQPGTAKTGTTRLTVGWLGGGMAPMPKELREWAALANNAHCIGHDNVSSLPPERSDLICRAASGDSYAGRRLYTNKEVWVMQFQQVSVILNTIDLALRGDLVRRAVVHELVKPAYYYGDAELAEAWTAVHPAALGWLFDRLCEVLERLPNIQAPQGETMPDFARVVLAVDSMWGTQAMLAWKSGQGMGYADLLDDDVVSWYITDRIKAPWEGTAQDLMTMLALPQLAGREWTPRLVSSRLDRCRTALEANGWVVKRPTDGHTKRRRIILVPPPGMNGIQPGPVRRYQTGHYPTS